ncbi:GTPase domain-containing protein, putative [Eimeria necatrix]|uniref:GTPase domain-containing protein, putative n=1 Tax=Eimeria necatrix TaxID=51315 RepID=U6MKZ2_9EIME|nr:GTPase domain-containing protein, putative [Eimeria necatrix]CDJ63114.1 GTPase domain-containing protein, putative [Eimeria necatrix]
MSRGVVELQKKAAEVDCLVEVRDARAPLTSSGCLEAIKPPKHLKRLIVLNKCDLVSSTDAKKAQELLQAAGLESVLVSAKQRKGLHKVTEWVLGTPEPKFSSIGRWLLLAGLPNTGKSSILNALKALAFSASFHGKPGNQLVQGVNKTTAKTGKLPGVTRDVNAFQLTNKPKVFCFDSPGILLPKNCDPGRSLILGVLGILPEHLIGEELAADYLLFQLNKNRQFGYVQVLGLNGPTNDIYEVSRHICQTLGRRQERFSLPPVDLSRGFVFFLNLFREGHLASLCLDTLPYAADVVLRRDVLGQQREPPDPWLLTDQEMPVPGLN